MTFTWLSSLIMILLVVFPFSLLDLAVASDIVELKGDIYDTAGNPVEDVVVEAHGLTDWSVSYGNTVTDKLGHYALSMKRPPRFESPSELPPFYKGRPVYEGYRMVVGPPAHGDRYTVLIDDTIMINTEGRNMIEQDIVLKPAGAIKLAAFAADGSHLKCYGPWGCQAYVTDLDWRVRRSSYIPDLGIFLVAMNETNVINIVWDALGFGKVVLRADNEGNGFVPTHPGEMIAINLNYELAKTQFRLLEDSYNKYLREDYVLSEELSPQIQSARELLRKATSAVTDSQRAHFANLCLNQTLWTGENLELKKAQQDIEKYRKGDATLQIVDENGEPVEHADVEISQTSHDFLFGADLVDRTDEAELMKEAGINDVLLAFNWWSTEQPLGTYRQAGHLSIESLSALKSLGMRIGAWELFCFEPSRMIYAPYFWEFSFEDLRAKVYEHVYKVVSLYADYVDYWIVAINPQWEQDSLGFTLQQIIDLIRIGLKAVRDADPKSKTLLFADDPDSYLTALQFQGPDDEFTMDLYSFVMRVNGDGVDNVGVATWLPFGSFFEGCPEPTLLYHFRDLASISWLLDWYGTLNVPMHITGFTAPSNWTSPLGYWHNMSWNEELKSQWVERVYTIAFAKPHIREMTYFFDDVPTCTDKIVTNTALFDRDAAGNFIPRQSYYTLKRLITEQWMTRLHLRTDDNGQLRFRGFAGDYNITVSAKDFTRNFTIHVDEQTSNTYTINLGRARHRVEKAKAEGAIDQAEGAVNRAKAEGRTIYLDRAENLLEDARKALIEENYTQAILLAEEANRAADNAVTWIVIPATIAFASGILSGSVILYRRVRAKKRKPSAV